MLKFYNLKEKMQTLYAQISWSHYCELLQIESINEINYYIMLVEEENLSVRQLRTRIKNRDYERLPEHTKNNLVNKEPTKVEELCKEQNVEKYNHVLFGKEMPEIK